MPINSKLLTSYPMKIALKKFGNILVSRPSGKEAFLALQPILKEFQFPEKEKALEIDFEGVSVFTPSWADEFLTPLVEKYPHRVSFLNTENPSVKATLETLEKAKNARREN